MNLMIQKLNEALAMIPEVDEEHWRAVMERDCNGMNKYRTIQGPKRPFRLTES